jgi:hypothetical protein
MEYLFDSDGCIFSVLAVICGVYMSFDLGSMKNFSTGVTNLTKLSTKSEKNVEGFCHV